MFDVASGSESGNHISNVRLNTVNPSETNKGSSACPTSYSTHNDKVAINSVDDRPSSNPISERASINTNNAITLLDSANQSISTKSTNGRSSTNSTNDSAAPKCSNESYYISTNENYSMATSEISKSNECDTSTTFHPQPIEINHLSPPKQVDRQCIGLVEQSRQCFGPARVNQLTKDACNSAPRDSCSHASHCDHSSKEPDLGLQPLFSSSSNRTNSALNNMPCNEFQPPTKILKTGSLVERLSFKASELHSELHESEHKISSLRLKDLHGSTAQSGDRCLPEIEENVDVLDEMDEQPAGEVDEQPLLSPPYSSSRSHSNRSSRGSLCYPHLPHIPHPNLPHPNLHLPELPNLPHLPNLLNSFKHSGNRVDSYHGSLCDAFFSGGPFSPERTIQFPSSISLERISGPPSHEGKDCCSRFSVVNENGAESSRLGDPDSSETVKNVEICENGENSALKVKKHVSINTHITSREWFPCKGENPVLKRREGPLKSSLKQKSFDLEPSCEYIITEESPDPESPSTPDSYEMIEFGVNPFKVHQLKQNRRKSCFCWNTGALLDLDKDDSGATEESTNSDITTGRNYLRFFSQQSKLREKVFTGFLLAGTLLSVIFLFYFQNFGTGFVH